MSKQEIIVSKIDAYLKILDEISQKETLYRPVMTRIKKGIKDELKDSEFLQE